MIHYEKLQVGSGHSVAKEGTIPGAVDVISNSGALLGIFFDERVSPEQKALFAEALIPTLETPVTHIKQNENSLTVNEWRVEDFVDLTFGSTDSIQVTWC